MSVVSPSPANGNIRLVRPLLEQRRSDLAAYARGHGIEFSEDSSNACLDMQRNRIRHELVPLLEQQYQPGLRQTVLRSMELIGSEGDWVAQTARKWLGQKRRSGFDRLHVAVQRRCLQLELVRLDERPDFDLIEWLRLNPGKAISVDAEHSLERKPSGEVVRHKHSPARFESGLRHEILVGRGGELSVEEWSIAWELVSQAGKVFGRSPGCEWFDADKVGAVVFVRHWQPGDRFQPSGAACASKLQDLFTNLKVPRGQRHERLLATTRGGEIFWVEGLRIGEHFKLDNETQRRLKWEWKREKRS